MPTKKKRMSAEDIIQFKQELEMLLRQPSWNKKKHGLKDDLDRFLNGFNCFHIERHIDFPKFTDGKPFLKWDFEIAQIPPKKRGFFGQFQNKKVLILCRDRGKYGRKHLIVVPVKI